MTKRDETEEAGAEAQVLRVWREGSVGFDGFLDNAASEALRG